ncbi:MAG TPA: YihY/virulence factor BrkB family protein [Bryobacteraceae bacterium]|nr:YihY/virulence factor BrkB family protein [Bryobacteraceae bacterium]
MRRLPYLLRRALFASFDDGLFTIAKGAAYSALLSFFPILATAATIFVQVRANFVRENVIAFLSQILPPGTEEVVLDQFRTRGPRPFTLLILAIVLALWAASSVIKSLIDGFNAAYRVPRNRSMLAHNGVGLMLALLSIVPLLGASSLILFGGTVEAVVLRLIKVDPILNPFAPWWEFLSRVMRYVIAFVATSTVTAILYVYGPYRKQRWGGVWPGSILATTLWLLGTLGFGWYVRHVTNYNVLYGSVGTSIALLIWMYLLAAIALFGCEFNAENERLLSHTQRQAKHLKSVR